MDKNGGIYISKENLDFIAGLEGISFKILFTVLILMKGHGKEYVYTSANHLTFMAGLSRPTVHKALNDLIRRGILIRKVIRYKEDGKYRTKTILKQTVALFQ